MSTTGGKDFVKNLKRNGKVSPYRLVRPEILT